MFDPSRYLTVDGQFDNDAPDPAEATFGFGRRICPGRHFAIDVLWITMASILATFDIEKPVDQFGTVIEPSGEYSVGFLRCAT